MIGDRTYHLGAMGGVLTFKSLLSGSTGNIEEVCFLLKAKKKRIKKAKLQLNCVWKNKEKYYERADEILIFS